jgi:PHD/YefM family antitoxin component YafN of YafNO toxin-antitoxin module
MQRQFELQDLARRGDAILDDLANAGEPFIVARDSKPVAVLIAYEDFLRWQRGTAESPDEHFDRVAERLHRLNTGLSDDELARDVAEAIAEVRASRSVSDEEVHERFRRLLDKMDRLNSGFSEEEVTRDVADAIDEVRRGR